MASTTDRAAIEHMLEAIEAVTRYAARGCSSLACDAARGAWIANQFTIIGQQAARVSAATRDEASDIPWAHLESLSGQSSTRQNMPTDEMQRLVERELPAIGRQLRQCLKAGNS